jgi:coenzyme F420-dependent glucose-6-phosphate dehydrogenase
MNEAPLGISWPDPKERFARLKEAIALIRLLWAEQRVDFDGTYYRTSRATIYDRPDIPVPLYVAGSGPSATRLAGRSGDGFITTSGKAPTLYTDSLLPAVRAGIAQSGRTPADVDMLIEVKVSFDHNLARARQDTKFWGALALSPDEKTGIEDPVEMEHLADDLPIERASSRFIVSSDPDEHVAAISRYLDLGFTHLVFHAPGPDQERFLRLYGGEILPRLRARDTPRR